MTPKTILRMVEQDQAELKRELAMRKAERIAELNKPKPTKKELWLANRGVR